jgi:hypothetical protein
MLLCGCQLFAGIKDRHGPTDAADAADAGTDAEQLDAMSPDGAADSAASDAPVDAAPQRDALPPDATPQVDTKHDREVEICTTGSCSGCCDNLGRCNTEGFPYCGVDGDACVQCDTARSNNCGEGATCQCGSKSPCPSGLQCVSLGICTLWPLPSAP